MKLPLIKEFIINNPCCDSRKESFLMTFEELIKRFGEEPILILETGTTRGKTIQEINGGGGSSIVFGKWCELTNSKLITVDISEESMNDCRSNTALYTPYIEYVVQDSASFLKNFNQKIHLLYLDSMDTSDWNNSVVETACQHQLVEAQNIIDKLNDNTLILLDDIKNPQFTKGKSEYSIPFFLKNGFKIIYYHQKCGQVLLSK